jgi:ABC-type transport system substrate-binding protein
MSRYRLITLILGLGTFALLGASSRTMAAPEGTLTFALHYSLPARWLDPAESESIITPYLTLYALHDALLKPTPGAGVANSLAESWSMSSSGGHEPEWARGARPHCRAWSQSALMFSLR